MNMLIYLNYQCDQFMVWNSWCAIFEVAIHVRGCDSEGRFTITCKNSYLEDSASKVMRQALDLSIKWLLCPRCRRQWRGQRAAFGPFWGSRRAVLGTSLSVVFDGGKAKNGGTIWGGASEIRTEIGPPHCNLAPGSIAYAESLELRG